MALGVLIGPYAPGSLLLAGVALCCRAGTGALTSGGGPDGHRGNAPDVRGGHRNPLGPGGASIPGGLLVGAIVTPTDPIGSSPIATGSIAKKNIPDRVPYNISFESGLNDGLAYLFVLLPVLLITKPDRA